MIKKNIPLNIIKKLIGIYSKEAIANHRDKNKKSLLQLAINKEVIDLVKVLMPFFDNKSFYLRSSDGSYPLLDA